MIAARTPAAAWRCRPVTGAARALGALSLVATTLSCGGDPLDPDRPAVASVAVSPDRLTVGVGASSPLTVEARDAAGTVVGGRKIVWATKDPSVATVSGGGVVTGVAPGTVEVAATVEGKSAIVDVTVTPKAVSAVRLTPAGDLRLLAGETTQLAAEALDADGAVLPERAITWTSNATSVATVSASGVVTAVAPGGAVITAASEGKSALVAVTVSSVPVVSVTITPATETVVVTQTLQLTAVAKDAHGGTIAGRTITWSTSDASRATVSSTGLVTGVSPGDVTITASAEGKSGTSAITVKAKPVGAVVVSPGQVTMETGQTRQLTATVTDDAGNVLTGRPITFTTDKPGIATVSSSGVVTGVAIGTARITATSEGKTGTADVTVTAVPVATVEVSPPRSDLTVGQTVTLAVTAKDARGNVLSGRPVAWVSGGPSVATVSNTGVVTAVGLGSAVIFATVEGRSGSATVNVTPPGPVATVEVSPKTANVTAGQSIQLTATLRDAKNNILTGRTVVWSSSNILRATVDAQGVVRTSLLNKGNVTITATSEGKSGTATITVK